MLNIHKRHLVEAYLIFAFISSSFIGCNNNESPKISDIFDPETAELLVDTDVEGQNQWDSRFDQLALVIDAERQQLGAPGAAFALIEDGEVVFAAGFGNRQPNRDDTQVVDTTLFRVGSITKVMTAVAAMQQVEQGNLSLDTPIAQSYPEFSFTRNPDWSKLITLRHALEQSTGQFDLGEFDSAPNTELESRYWWYLDNYWLSYPSGRMWNYANPNYTLTGWLIEETSSESYGEYMDSNVFTPLEMNRTFFMGDEVIQDGNYAIGLTTNWNTGEGAVLALPDSYDSAFLRPAGFAYSTVYDMAKFVEFLMNGNEAVLEDTKKNEITTGQISTLFAQDLEQYGFGLFVTDGFALGDDYYPIKTVSHGGDLAGFAADMMYIPSLSSGIVAFASTDGAHLYQSIAYAISLLDDMPEPQTKPDAYMPDPNTYGQLLGSYTDPYQVGEVYVSLEGDRLKVEFPLLDDLNISYSPNLIPHTRDNFILILEGRQELITFVRDENGNGEFLRHRFFVCTNSQSKAKQQYRHIQTTNKLPTHFSFQNNYPTTRAITLLPPVANNLYPL